MLVRVGRRWFSYPTLNLMSMPDSYRSIGTLPDVLQFAEDNTLVFYLRIAEPD